MINLRIWAGTSDLSLLTYAISFCRILMRWLKSRGHIYFSVKINILVLCDIRWPCNCVYISDI